MRFSTTIVSSFLATGALLAAAEARASSLYTIPSSDSSGTINLGSFSEWATLNTKYGAFGAGFDASDQLTATTTNQLSEAIGASANLTLFGNTFTLVGFGVSANNPAANYITANVTQTILGQTVLNNVPLAVTNSSSSFSLAVCVSTTDYKLASGKSPGEAEIMVGPIPIYMAVAAAVCPQLSVSGSGSYTAGTYSDITFTATPGFNIGATAQVGIGTKVASIGVNGSLSLLNVSLPLSNTLSYTNAIRQMQYSSTGTVDISTLSGSFGLYASAGWGPFSVEYDYTLFSWGGYHWSYGVFSDAKPAATDVTLTVSGGSVSGTYSYQGYGAIEGGSTFRIQRADTSSGGGTVADLAYGKNYTLNQDPTPYLRFCVTPKSVSNVSGVEACSSWVPVGSKLALFDFTNGSGTNKAYAYENSDSGHCFNLASDSFDNMLSSLYFQKPSIKPGHASLILYQGSNCSGATATVHDTDTPGTMVPLNDMNVVFGNGWDNTVSSFAVYYNEVVSAKNLDIAWTGPYARPVYGYSDTAGRGESGTKYRWQRAWDPAGTSPITIQDYSTTSQYALKWNDNDSFLRVCVLPSDGYVIGSETCTNFIPVGKLLSFWANANDGGTNMHFPYEHWTSGTCVNLAAYGFDNTMSSWYFGYRGFTNPDNGFYGVTLASDPNCAGATLTSQFTAGGNPGDGGATYIGDAWNDVTSSFKVTYRKVEALGASVAFAGPRAIPRYMFADSHNLSESGSTYQWEIADDTNGTNGHVIQAYGTTSAHAIPASEQGKSLRVCVKPSDGVIVGPESCSPFKAIDPDVTQYFSFDGVNDYALAPSDVWFPGSSFTVMAWVYVDAITNWARVFDFGNGPWNNNVLLAASIGTTGRPRFSVHKNGVEYPVDSPVAIPVGQWTHVAGVFDGTTGHLYINGSEVASGPMPVPNQVTRNNAFIGRSNWSADAYFKGKLADFRINSMAYSSNEIKLAFTGVDYPTSDHLSNEHVRYLRMGDANSGTAGKIVDSTLHKLHATYLTP